MNLSKLLGRKLKEDETIDVLKECGVDKVVYDFDRLHENEPDVYWAGSEAKGFLLRFSEQQVCVAVFCYILPSEGFNPIDPTWAGVTIFRSYEEAERHCHDNHTSYSVAKQPVAGSWLRVDASFGKVHYEFRDGDLALITLSSDLPNVAA